MSASPCLDQDSCLEDQAIMRSPRVGREGQRAGWGIAVSGTGESQKDQATRCLLLSEPLASGPSGSSPGWLGAINQSTPSLLAISVAQSWTNAP